MIEADSQQVLSREDLSNVEQGREAVDPVASEARSGLLSSPRTLAPWLFYDEVGSQLFDRITALPEYYLTRTERGIFTANAGDIVAAAANGERLTIVELGAGTAAKTGLLLRACVSLQGQVLYEPIDVSPSALDEARRTLERDLPGVTVRPQVANYITDRLRITRQPHSRLLALYIGSSIGNFSPEQARDVLRNLRQQLRPGDSLLLGTDLVPGRGKSVDDLQRAYDDAAGVTAEFNRNVLRRLNRNLGADFDVECFAHRAVWNAEASRMEMHLVARGEQTVVIPRNSAGTELRLMFFDGETIHTENSYKFSASSISALMGDTGFTPARTWQDVDGRFAVTLATAV